MRSLIKYLELKTGFADDGPAWIAKVEFSKSKKSIYFNDRCLMGNGHGNCQDIETDEVFWVSGIKKNGEDRHSCGSGKIFIDRNIIDDYLEITGRNELDTTKFTVIDIKKTKKSRFTDIQNSNFSAVTTLGDFYDLSELNEKELLETIIYLKRKESYTQNKFLTQKIVEAERYLKSIQEDKRFI